MNERDELLARFEAARTAEGTVTERHAPRLTAAREALANARQAFRDADDALRKAHHEHLVESIGAANQTASIEHKLRAMIPSEVADAIQRLDAAIARVRETPDADRDDAERLRRLLALRSEAADMHLWGAKRLKVNVTRINTAIERVGEMTVA